jgi:hypothetical protein
MDATPSRFGQVNQAGDDEALFLKMFAGEVLGAFNLANIFMDKHQVRTISAGKSAQFPATGKVTAAYHTPGEEIVGSGVNSNERTITIDDLLLASTYVAQIDELKGHFDVRSEYSKQIGESLAKEFDENVAQVGVLAARASATVSDGDGGSQVSHADNDTVGATIAASLFSAAQKFDEKGIPEGDRWAAFRPAQYFLLAQTTAVINRDWDGRGSYGDGKVFMVAGLPIVKSNRLPSTDITTGPSAYQPTSRRPTVSCGTAQRWERSSCWT